MNIVFFGSANFAVPSLKALLGTAHKVSCVVTQPDRIKGRGLFLQGTPVKSTALEAGARIYQPESSNSAEAEQYLKGLNADLFIVVAYGQILSEAILDIPKVFSINAHASILPRYRGAAPINWAVIRGEKKTGVTIIKMTKKMDAGPVILKKNLDISDDDSALDLEDKLSHLAAQALIETLRKIEDNNFTLTPQEEENMSLAPKLGKDDGRIAWPNTAQNIYNLIRGCLPWPGAFTYYNGKLLKVYKAKVFQLSALSSQLSAGQVIKVDKDIIIVACGKDYLSIEELQIEGKRKMAAEEFICGHKISAGEKLG